MSDKTDNSPGKPSALLVAGVVLVHVVVALLVLFTLHALWSVCVQQGDLNVLRPPHQAVVAARFCWFVHIHWKLVTLGIVVTAMIEALVLYRLLRAGRVVPFFIANLAVVIALAWLQCAVVAGIEASSHQLHEILQERGNRAERLSLPLLVHRTDIVRCIERHVRDRHVDAQGRTISYKGFCYMGSTAEFHFFADMPSPVKMNTCSGPI